VQAADAKNIKILNKKRFSMSIKYFPWNLAMISGAGAALQLRVVSSILQGIAMGCVRRQRGCYKNISSFVYIALVRR
jgi:hypothetical protein